MLQFLRKFFHFKITGFVSKADQFLTKWDVDHRPTPSQQAEMDKYKRVYALRGPLKKEKK